MKKPLDKVTDAYFNELGDSFGERIRNRIHWICEHAKGETILDIGCSQGITSIILGREGKRVLGMDLLQESIDYANNMLKDEEEITKKYVQFISANFMDYDFEEKFDCIIMGEVLEHITDPQRFVKKASQLLSENGKIIITVPFGINDYFDHKKTYYLLDLFRLLDKGIEIEEINFLGKWVGLVLSNSLEQGISIDEGLLHKLEDAFYSMERQYVKDIASKNNSIKKLKEKHSEDTKNFKAKINQKDRLIADYENQVSELNGKISSLNDQIIESGLERKNNEKLSNSLIEQKEQLISELTEKVSMLTEKDIQISKLKVEVSSLKKLENSTPTLQQDTEKEVNTLRKLLEVAKLDVIKVRKEKVSIQEKLLNSYNKEQTLLNTYKKLLKNNKQLESRYKALRSSKLGKITVYYWQWRRKKKLGGK
ncbi:methyltransferase domain-containing protein [Fictibacillus nanhaiensis]|uniref:Methyltransferase domain-containing protein n=1 Tax=Fictibacillus nanhaiensis TaxID=742169 RepID=A0ABS2ZM75_9BACL|nr:methyltransferase domain-containing protein [Fictibacillus nanhaiensis]